MSLMVYLGFAGHQMAFDILGLLILTTVLVLLGLAVWQHLLQRRKLAAWTAGLALLLALVQIPRGVMAPAASWATMHQAIEESNGPERHRRIAEFGQAWRFRAITALDWYLLSRRWQVCHGMWEERDCRATSNEPEGLAREALDDIVRTVPRVR